MLLWKIDTKTTIYIRLIVVNPFFFFGRLQNKGFLQNQRPAKTIGKHETLSQTLFKVTNNLQFLLLYQLLAKTTQFSDFVNNHTPRTVDMNSQ